MKKQINLQSTDQLQKTLATLKNNFKAEQNQKDMETANRVYKTLINQIEIELNSREDNKLIAEFMGLSIKEGVCYYTDADDMFPMGVEVEEPHLPYDTSWDWLMPVVEKISDAKSWSINATLEWLSESQDRDGFYDRDGIFQSVVEFINQLNR